MSKAMCQFLPLTFPYFTLQGLAQGLKKADEMNQNKTGEKEMPKTLGG